MVVVLYVHIMCIYIRTVSVPVSVCDEIDGAAAAAKRKTRNDSVLSRYINQTLAMFLIPFQQSRVERFSDGEGSSAVPRAIVDVFPSLLFFFSFFLVQYNNVILLHTRREIIMYIY